MGTLRLNTRKPAGSPGARGNDRVLGVRGQALTTDAEAGVRGGSVTSHAEQAVPRALPGGGSPGPPGALRINPRGLSPSRVGLDHSGCRTRAAGRGTDKPSPCSCGARLPGLCTEARTPSPACTYAGETLAGPGQGAPAHMWHVLSPLRPLTVVRHFSTNLCYSTTQALRPAHRPT